MLKLRKELHDVMDVNRLLRYGYGFTLLFCY